MTLQGRNPATALVVLSAFVPNLFLVGQALAQANAQDTMNMTAKVVNPLQVSPSLNFKLNFQSFAVKGSGSFVVMPGGTSAISKGVTIGGATAGTAVLKVPQNVSFTLSVPTFQASSVKLTFGGGGAASKEMTLKSLLFENVSKMLNITATIKNGNAKIPGIKITNPANTGKLAVGAKIKFHPNQAVGTYHGSFVVRITL